MLWTVTGSERATGKRLTVEIDAPSRAAAQREAEHMGLLVGHIGQHKPPANTAKTAVADRGPGHLDLHTDDFKATGKPRSEKTPAGKSPESTSAAQITPAAPPPPAPAPPPAPEPRKSMAVDLNFAPATEAAAAHEAPRRPPPSDRASAALETKTVHATSHAASKLPLVGGLAGIFVVMMIVVWWLMAR